MAARTGAGRPRDPELDAAIVTAACELLSEAGVDGVTYERVAERAGTTRPAVYRRHPALPHLLIAALAELGTSTAPVRTDDPFADLVAELESFRSAISEARSVGLVGDMLSAGADPTVLASYRERIVRPRRSRLTAIVDDAATAGSISGTADDRLVAVSMCTGSWYALALAGATPPADWAPRTAQLVWRALGGA